MVNRKKEKSLSSGYSSIEYRVAALRKKIEEEGVEAFLIKDPQNTAYLSYCGIEGRILLSGREKFFITTPLFAEEAKSRLNDWQIIIQKDGFEETVLAICRQLKSKRVGFEASYFSFAEYKKLEQSKEVKWVPLSGLVENQRVVKDRKELSCIKQALRVTRAAFGHLENRLEGGITEKELSNEAIYFFRENADKEAFPPIVLFGERTSLPHGRPTQRRLKKNEMVTLDLGAKVGGYCSDLTRTVFFGKVRKKWQQIHHLITGAQKGAIKDTKPGVSCSDIDRIIRNKIEKAGYGEQFIHSSGHGVGLAVHELPAIARKSKEVLKTGMVFTLEPGIYLEKEGGVRVEEMIVVTEEGGRILNDQCQ